ncbi:hypothetical protein EDD85DRAFT_931222, partial [Armillaria nabsnona]
MYLYNARSYWKFVKLKIKIAVYKRMRRKVLRKSVLEGTDRESDDGFPKVTISSQTEIGRTEESIQVPNQRAYTGRKSVISASLADTPCSSLGILRLLCLLDTTLGTLYTLDTPPRVSSVLKDCIAQKYDVGTAYGRLHSVWCYPE